MLKFLPNIFHHISRVHITSLYLRLGKIVLGFLAFFLISTQITAQSATPAESLQESIRSFHSQINIQTNGDLEITETIEFFTPTPRHGIYRQIPYRYNRDGWRFTARVTDVEVQADGQDVPTEQSTDGAFLTLKIGDPDVTFSGPRKYQISYTVEHAVQAAAQDKNLPQLYWDITGESWRLPILKTTATINSPSSFTESRCFSGPFGQDDQLCQISLPNQQTATVEYDQVIEYGDNVTVRLNLDPSGPVQAPTQNQKIAWWLQDHWPLFLLVLPPAAMLYFYAKRGRDWWYSGSLHTPNVAGEQKQYWPWSLPAIPMSYEPPDDLSPGEASILLQEQVPQMALVAEILELARKKFLALERRGKNTYWFVQTQPPKKAKPLSQAQRTLLDGIFAGRTSTALSTLKGTFYTTVHKAQEELEAQLVQKKLVSGKSSMVRGVWITIGLTSTGTATVIAAGILSPFIPGVFWLLAIVGFILSFLCGYAMPRRTAAGSNAAWKIKGLQKSIQRGAWREKIKEKHLFIEEILPFAVALGVVKQLSRDLKDLHIQPPEYAEALIANGILSNSLVQGFSNTATQSFSPPASSSSEWGGDGGSGGGGGGGGGGSW